jgi:hypothetical protein
MKVTAFPSVLGNNLFGLVVDVEDWGFKWLTILKIKGSEHASGAEIALINEEFLVFSKGELGFSDDFSLHIHNVVVLYNTKLLVLMLFGLVTDTDKHEFVTGHFPHGGEGALCICKAIWGANLLFDSVGFISD